MNFLKKGVLALAALAATPAASGSVVNFINVNLIDLGNSQNKAIIGAGFGIAWILSQQFPSVVKKFAPPLTGANKKEVDVFLGVVGILGTAEAFLSKELKGRLIVGAFGGFIIHRLFDVTLFLGSKVLRRFSGKTWEPGKLEAYEASIDLYDRLSNTEKAKEVKIDDFTPAEYGPAMQYDKLFNKKLKVKHIQDSNVQQNEIDEAKAETLQELKESFVVDYESAPANRLWRGYLLLTIFNQLMRESGYEILKSAQK